MFELVNDSQKNFIIKSELGGSKRHLETSNVTICYTKEKFLSVFLNKFYTNSVFLFYSKANLHLTI